MADSLWSEEAEVCVLGAMLIDEEARAEALDRLEPEDFWKSANRTIFRAFGRLNGRGREADVTLLHEELRAADELEAAGGMPYLAQLVDAVPNGRRISDHAERLRELRNVREVRSAANEVLQSTESMAPGEAPEALAGLEERLREARERTPGRDRGGLRTATEILEDPDAGSRPATVADRLAWEELVSLLAGREKAGKSTLLRFSAARLTQGRHVWNGEPTAAGPRTVLYWAEERVEDVAADLKRIGADTDLVSIRDMRFVTGDRFSRLRRDVEEVDPGLLIVDTLQTFTDPMDLDSGSASDWSPVMSRFGALAQEYVLAVLLNHHATKHDGSYRDSTAIGAGVDAILELRRDPQEGDNVRTVTAKARASADARDFKYEFVDAGDRPHLELLDTSLSLDERVHRFVRRHQGCGQRDVIEGVRGGRDEIRSALNRLCEDGGPLVVDDRSMPYEYRTRQNPRGNGQGTG